MAKLVRCFSCGQVHSSMGPCHRSPLAGFDDHLTGVDRAVANSPPPCPDVGGTISDLVDPGMGPFKGDEIMKLLDERYKTHGSFATNARLGQTLRTLFRKSNGWVVATDRQREALDYIAGKLARILSGQPDHADHWDDIAGYAKLACHPDIQR